MRAVSEAGFDGVSLGLQQVEGCESAAASLLDRHGLRCPDVLPLLVGRDEDVVLATAHRLARLAESVRAQFVLALFYTRVSDESLDRFGRCAEIIASAGAKLALEMPPVGELDHLPAALRVVDAVGRDLCCLLVDTFHFFRGSSTWSQLESLPLDALGYVQFDDALAPAGEDVMADTMDRRAMPGEGELDLRRFAGTLVDRGWSGWVSVEVLSSEMRRLDVEEFASRAYASSAPYWLTPSVTN
jgi:sugar phosphate isomerase/epimerase